MTEQLRQKLGGYDRAWARRQLVLAFSLSLLVLLAFIVTAHAYVAKETKSTLVEFNGGSFYFTALLDIPPDIDSVQLIPIGLTGDMQLSDNPLPVRLANVGTVGHKDFVYVVGGTDDNQVVRNEVYSALTSLEGGEITPWQTLAALPAGRAGAGMALYPLNDDETVLYVVGGRRPNYQPADTVYRGVIDNDTGQIESWETDDEHLLFPLFYASTVQHDGALYVIGGVSSFAFNRVDYATINADGSLNPFTATAPLPEALYSSVAVVYEGPTTDTLYLVGGRNQYTSTFKVYFADFMPGGGLTPWQLSDGSLPVHLYGHGGIYLDGEIILSGGVVNAVDPTAGISDTVKAALVDPSNLSFRLYDWCLGVPPPTCTIGAWQTGGLLPEARSLHGMATGNEHIYVVGGQDDTLKARDTVYYGTVMGDASLYAPRGEYLSYEIDLGQTAGFRRFAWGTTLNQPEDMGITMQYRHRSPSGDWGEWSAPQPSVQGYNEIDFDPAIDNVRFVQYKAVLTTTAKHTSPLLDWVEIYYELDDPELEVRKDTGGVYTVPLGGYLDYTIYYTNTGRWVARDVVLTETLPANTTYAGGPEWYQVGSSNVYTYFVGDLARGVSDEATFRIRVRQSVPQGTKSITNHVEIDYPLVYDEIGQPISDPLTGNNWDEWSTPLSIYAITITKEADPSTSQYVEPGSIINYTIYYTNTGLRAASQTVLTDVFDLEDDYTILSANPPPDRDSHIWDLGRLAPGEGGRIDISVQIADPLPNGWLITNQAVLHSPEGDAEYTPVLTHVVMNPPVPMVDLTVTGLRMQPAAPEAGAPVVIIADIANVGTADAGPFWVELYVKPVPSTPPLRADDHEGGYFPIGGGSGRLEYTWNPAGLASGMGASISFPRPGYSWSDNPFPQECTTYDVYVQIDVAASVPPDNAYWGIYAEDDETNNLVHLTYETPFGPKGVYLPLVAKD